MFQGEFRLKRFPKIVNGNARFVKLGALDEPAFAPAFSLLPSLRLDERPERSGFSQQLVAAVLST